jgi:hypothetical protein
MKVLAGLITQGTGSLGGMTMSKNKAGYYLRARTVPSNPRSALQSAIRSGLAAYATYWKSLTAAQIAKWGLYAANTPTVGNNGQTRLLSGFNWFVACNQVRLQAGYALVSDAPTTFGQASAPIIVTCGYITDSVIEVNFSLLDGPVAADSGDVVLVFAGKPKSLGVAYFNGPWQFIGALDSYQTGTVNTDLTGKTPYIATPTSQSWFRFVRSKPDGTYSTQVIAGPSHPYS